MPQTCKGLCQQLLDVHNFSEKQVRKYIPYGYRNGYKQCSICEVFIKTSNPMEIRCFCCGVQLRARPYKSTLKHKLLTSIIDKL